MDDDSFETADDILRELLGDDYAAEGDPAPPRESSLCDSVLKFQNEIVYCVPYEGWGWSIYDSDDWIPDPSVDLRAPARFQLKIDSFFEWNSNRRGGFGTVETEQSEFFGQWALFYTYNQAGVFDFASRIARYWIHIGGSKRPELFPEDHEPSGEFWPLPKFGDCRRYSGMAVLAASGPKADKELGL